MVVIKTILALLGDIAVWEIAMVTVLFAMALWYERSKNKRITYVLELTIHYTLVLVFPLAVITVIVLFFAGFGFPIGRPY